MQSTWHLHHLIETPPPGDPPFEFRVIRKAWNRSSQNEGNVSWTLVHVYSFEQEADANAALEKQRQDRYVEGSIETRVENVSGLLEYIIRTRAAETIRLKVARVYLTGPVINSNALVFWEVMKERAPMGPRAANQSIITRVDKVFKEHELVAANKFALGIVKWYLETSPRVMARNTEWINTHWDRLAICGAALSNLERMTPEQPLDMEIPGIGLDESERIFVRRIRIVL